MKLGLSVKINVSKIDKERLFNGEKGTYLDLTTFIDLDNPGEYGDHGFISQSISKEERANGVQGNILGNVKVFYRDTNNNSGGAAQQAPAQENSFDDKIPF